MRLAIPLTLALVFTALASHMNLGTREVQVRAAADTPTATPTAGSTAAGTTAAGNTAAAPAPAAAPTSTTTPAPTGQAQTQTQGTTQMPAAIEGRKGEQQVAAGLNTNCTLRVPANPLSARGLATPYQLSGSGGGGPCNEANGDQAAFVEATIIDRATGTLRVYHPLVVDQGTQPAVRPVVPALSRSSVVGIWFGSNGDTLSLTGTGRSLTQGNCVNGLGDSTFGQFAYCNAPAFFTAANAAIADNRLTVPPLGTGNDGMPCPTVRDFGVVDQDQSDNVTTTYLATADGRTAQNTDAAAGQLGQATMMANGSDNRLLDSFIDPALGCTPFTAPDVTDNGKPTTSLALNELQAAAHQAAPIALIPLNNPMTLVGDQQSVDKTNLYRAGVDQPAIDPATETPQAYCTNLQDVGGKRLAADQNLFEQAPSPDAANANLFDFLTQRMQGSVEQLNCAAQ